MGTSKKTQRITNTPIPGNSSVSARNLRKTDLGGVIFGCKNCTMAECLSKQLFGLPSLHFSYVKKVEPGLRLFLFNYTDRMLHGIFEAAGHGQMNIDSYAWTDDGRERTSFPAQVRIRVITQCNPLLENQFKKVIEDNYYSPPNLFWFELDHAQTRGLTALFTPSNVKPALSRVVPSLPVKPTLAKPAPAPVASSLPVNPTLVKPTLASVASGLPVNPTPALFASSWADLLKAAPSTALKATGDQKSVDTEAWEPKKDPKSSSNSVDDYKFESVQLYDADVELGNSSGMSSSATGDMESNDQVSDWEDLIDDNVQVTSSCASPHLDSDDQTLEKQQSGDAKLKFDAKLALLKLKTLSANRTFFNSASKCCISSSAIPCTTIDVYQNSVPFSEEPVDLTDEEENSTASDLSRSNAEVEINREMKQLMDQVKYLETRTRLLEDRVRELESKNDQSTALDDSLNKFVEQCLGSENVIYLIGGFNGSTCLSSLDSFSPSLDILTPLKPMSCSRSYASAVALNGSLYVFGGGDGSTWYDSVEHYDPRHDEWTSCPHMICEKGSLAGATLNNKIFAIGGGDGSKCFSDVEMFDPALGRWINNQSMLSKRFAPAAAELRGALYAVGGYDGKDYLMSAERFDPRVPYWIKLPSMKTRRGCHALAVFDEKLYAMGGYDGEKIVSSVEIFDPRLGSWMMGEPMNSVRAYAAAVVLSDYLLIIGGVDDDQKIVDTVECYKVGSDWADSGLKGIGMRSFCPAVVL